MELKVRVDPGPWYQMCLLFSDTLKDFVGFFYEYFILVKNINNFLLFLNIYCRLMENESDHFEVFLRPKVLINIPPPPSPKLRNDSSLQLSRLCLCMSVCLCVLFLFVLLFICLSVCLSVCVCVCLSVCVSVCLSPTIMLRRQTDWLRLNWTKAYSATVIKTKFFKIITFSFIFYSFIRCL